jgi:DNA processing protein
LQYPAQLREVGHALPLFYFRGDLSLLTNRCVSVVGGAQGDRVRAQASAEAGERIGEAWLHGDSGLARGIDTAAMAAAIKAGGTSWE